MLGQLAGDSLGGLVEFQSPADIRQQYPDGVRKLIDGGTWDLIAGQPTDDSEMALMLARMLVDNNGYDPDKARRAYVFWLDSGPFSCGATVSGGLRGRVNPKSQANGAMMRISPLGIFGANYGLSQVADWARQDARITHIHPVCVQTNALFTMAISHAVKTGINAYKLYKQVVDWARDMHTDESIIHAINNAADSLPDFLHHQGWVLIAFQNALWQLVHAPNLEDAVVDTVMHGGDTDTNAAICGALLGAVYGEKAIPAQWTDSILNCRPQAPVHVHHTRPECFWPVDAQELAEKLVRP